MSGTPNYLKAGDINRSTRSREIVDYLKYGRDKLIFSAEIEDQRIMMRHKIGIQSDRKSQKRGISRRPRRVFPYSRMVGRFLCSTDNYQLQQ